MHPNRIKALVVTGVAAGLCFGFGGPAKAHNAPDRSASVPAFQPATLTQVQSYVDTLITLRIQHLDAFAAKVVADPRLTAEQKARFAAKVAEVRQRLLNLKAAIDAATSTQQVHEILEHASPGLFFPGRPHHLRLHHHAAPTAVVDPTAEVREHQRTLPAFDPRGECHHGAGDPAAWQRYSGTRSYQGWPTGGYRYFGGYHHRH